MNLKSMSIDRLAGLRDRVDAALSAKVIDQRRALASELSKLTHFQGGGVRGKSALGRGARGPVAAKYRNPENASETWAGRGLRPRWLAAALKSGKKLEHFSIAAHQKAAPKKMRAAPKKARGK